MYEQWEVLTLDRNLFLGLIWKNLCPPKVEILAWMIIQERVATKSVLLLRTLC
ncbi:hypothetical protein RHMOL_Rhmol05G0173500 [Rhododendron molle]|uniref:Uncharacterized protein n=1 Tax=Rhododendron molle TaxID=49168 RepID=A0ACC0NRA9_RHOML|nr:hypothetical protein RHMOL_Rhmol05G0173500 [Rhododendron molle]